jgi:hypothetical protein
MLILRRRKGLRGPYTNNFVSHAIVKVENKKPLYKSAPKTMGEGNPAHIGIDQ